MVKNEEYSGTLFMDEDPHYCNAAPSFSPKFTELQLLTTEY